MYFGTKIYNNSLCYDLLIPFRRLLNDFLSHNDLYSLKSIITCVLLPFFYTCLKVSSKWNVLKKILRSLKGNIFFFFLFLTWMLFFCSCGPQSYSSIFFVYAIDLSTMHPEQCFPLNVAFWTLQIPWKQTWPKVLIESDLCFCLLSYLIRISVSLISPPSSRQGNVLTHWSKMFIITVTTADKTW